MDHQLRIPIAALSRNLQESSPDVAWLATFIALYGKITAVLWGNEKAALRASVSSKI